MATIRKRGDTYQIRVSLGYDKNGNHKEQAMTWKPDEGMSERQIQKELNRQAVMFEEACMHGYKAKAVKFEELAEEWFEEYAKINLRSTTYERMKQLTHRIYPTIGHLRLDKITGRHIQQFINDLINSTSERTGRPLARKTVIHHLSFISDVFSYAVKMDMLTYNPCRKVTVPKDEADVVAVSGDLGHSQVSTTTNIYCHMFQEAQARTSHAIADALIFDKKEKQGGEKAELPA